ncbi:MAG: LuxR family transcriptional regulator [Leucobacter sp.]|jgi:quercetin dioxygenase-like cupin family protein|nr:LuxR family transcriptional regulator [Leucobacter sp.]
MQPLSLRALAAEKLDEARNASSGRSAVTIYGGREHRLRQTLLGLKAGAGLSEHESPGEATLQVLIGTIVLRTADESWRLSEGQHMTIPDEVHAVDTLEDAAFLLTVSVRERHTD